jgi:hypothetical protein
MSEDIIRISVPRVLTSTIVRCINCAFSQDDDGSSLTIQLAASMTTYFYLDAPYTVTRLRQWASSEFQQAVRVTEELGGTELHHPKSKRYVDEIMVVVEIMRGNLTASNYELVLGRLDRVRELHALVTEEEENYTQAEEHIDSVREEIL